MSAVALGITLALSAAFLIVSMSLTAVAAADINKKDYTSAHKFAMYASIAQGIVAALYVAVLLLVIWGGKSGSASAAGMFAA